MDESEMAVLEIMDKPKSKKPARKPGTEVARQLFMYGEGDGVRILDAVELAAKSGVHRETIRQRMPEWLAELEGKLQETSKLGSLSPLSVPKEVTEKHTEDLQFFRRNLNALQGEHDSFEQIIDKLAVIVENLSTDPNKADDAMNLFDRYLRLSMNKRNLMKQIIDLKKIWDEKVGLDSIKNIQEAVGKSMAVKGAGENPSPSGSEAGLVPVFKKR